MRLHNRLSVFIFCLLSGLILSLCLSTGNILPVFAQNTFSASIENQLFHIERQEQQGIAYYKSQQYAVAVKTWKQLLRTYESQGNYRQQAKILSNLSLAYQQLGQWEQAKQAITRSLKLLQSKLTQQSPKNLQVLAQALNTQGALQLAIGKPEDALNTWKQATQTYTKAKNSTGAIRSAINQSQAYRALGLYGRSLSTLTEIKQILQQQTDSSLKAIGLNNLGINLTLMNRLDEAQTAFQQSLAIAQNFKSPTHMSAALISLGNVARARKNPQAAEEFYQQAINIAPDPNLQIRAQLNQLKIFIDTQKWQQAQSLGNQIQAKIANLPPSRFSIYTQLNLVENLTNLHQANVSKAPTIVSIAQIVVHALQQAQALGDKRAKSHALGTLGKIYTETQQWTIARDLTEKALVLSQAMNAPEITYKWQWQLGRILQAQGNKNSAVVAYQEAVKNLKSLRRDLVGIDSDVQFSFRDSVEPVYRELVSLLLQPNNLEPLSRQKSLKTSSPSQKDLQLARQAIESLQLAELDNFFREACLDLKPTQIEQFDTQAAVIYPIILADRLEIILSLPHQPLHQYVTSIPQPKLESTAAKLRQYLVIRSRNSFMPLSQQLYDWLIRPAASDISNSGIKTLVFVLDGVLRNIPMAALHDGKQYLLEKYSIALTPSLQLLPPKKLTQINFQVLGSGLTEARQGFPALDYVEQELDNIKSEVPTVVLLNQKFTQINLEKKLRSSFSPIVHIATHGQFSSKAAETFILTWSDRIGIGDLDRILQIGEQNQKKPIELLVLSACETAAGDKQAALGLAGIAVKAGARSTLATLWSVNDRGTAVLMSQFYRQITNTQQTRAEALRQSQLALLKDPMYEHPIYWAPYILVGNWL
ncbi:MAG: CHAT domain-containing protein [Calothrix sp. MO_167.B12]|nr:CHAT domain-containing protein [Calothrix sp. MO_167.B12]